MPAASRAHRILRRIALIAGAAALLTATLAGCGAAKPDARRLLADTFGAGHPIRSGRLDANLRVDGSGGGLSRPFVLGASGPFTAGDPGRMPRFALEFQFGPGTPAAGLISTGKKGYLTLEGQPFVLAAATYARMQRSYAASRSKGAAGGQERVGLAALGVDPGRWIKDAKVAGERDVSGTPTFHITGRVDVAALLGDVDRILRRTGSLPRTAQTRGVPDRLDPQVRAALERSVRDAAIEVDTGKSDHTLRRLQLRLRLTVAAADRALLGDLRSLGIDLDVALAQLGSKQAIVAPKHARPAEELVQALATLGTAGSATQGTATTPPTGTGTTPTNTGTTPQTNTGTTQSSPLGAYDDCLARAGNDLRKLQSCAPLAGAQ